MDTPLPPRPRLLARGGPGLRRCSLRAAGARGDARSGSHVPFPEAEVGALAAGAPPMPGGEYLDTAALAALWEAMTAACRAELGRVPRRGGGLPEVAATPAVARGGARALSPRGEPGGPRGARSRSWRPTARGCRAGAGPSIGPWATPFASTRARATGHGSWPCSSPCSARRRGVRWLRELVDSGDVYQPLAWTPRGRLPVPAGHPGLRGIAAWWCACPTGGRRSAPPRPQRAGHGRRRRARRLRDGRAARLRRAA